MIMMIMMVMMMTMMKTVDGIMIIMSRLLIWGPQHYKPVAK